MTETAWRAQSEAKRQSILNAIPEKWRLQDPVPPATELRDVTGYIRQYLTEREIDITETDAVDIAAQTTTGTWSATEVTEAFCHRAALAHQLVRSIHLRPIATHNSNKTSPYRLAASTKFSSKQQSKMQKTRTPTLQSTKPQ